LGVDVLACVFGVVTTQGMEVARRVEAGCGGGIPTLVVLVVCLGMKRCEEIKMR
jgi:hypothetical protein